MGRRAYEWELQRNGAYGIEQEERASAGISTDYMALIWYANSKTGPEIDD